LRGEGRRPYSIAVNAAAPAVSVVLPTFNRAPLLCDALQSVLEQSASDFELIVVDDGSTDGTAALLEEVASVDARVRPVHQENGGTASARNAGIEHARAPWIAFLDSDDVWLPGYLAGQIAFAAAHPEADAVLCDALYVGAWKEEGRTAFSRNHWRTPSSIEAMCNGAWALPSCLLIRTGIVQALRFSTEFRHSEDTEFLFRFNLNAHRLLENPEVLTLYRKHEQEGVEPQKMDNALGILKDNLRVLERYADRAADPKVMRYKIDRRWSLLLAEQGRWAEARPYLWRWYKHKPDSTRALRFLIRSLFARKRPPAE